MADRLSPQQRHNTMAAIKGKDTKPEMIVRRYLWSHGYRYRLNHRRLPGKPDVVLTKYRTCVFVNGCFWHGHEGCKFYSIPRSNPEYWKAKFARNRERDLEVMHRLAAMGWHTITIWECELKPDRREQTLASLVYTLNYIYLQDRRPHNTEPQPEIPQTLPTTQQETLPTPHQETLPTTQQETLPTIQQETQPTTRKYIDIPDALPLAAEDTTPYKK